MIRNDLLCSKSSSCIKNWLIIIKNEWRTIFLCLKPAGKGQNRLIVLKTDLSWWRAFCRVKSGLKWSKLTYCTPKSTYIDLEALKSHLFVIKAGFSCSKTIDRVLNRSTVWKIDLPCSKSTYRIFSILYFNITLYCMSSNTTS